MTNIIVKAAQHQIYATYVRIPNKNGLVMYVAYLRADLNPKDLLFLFMNLNLDIFSDTSEN